MFMYKFIFINIIIITFVLSIPGATNILSVGVKY